MEHVVFFPGPDGAPAFRRLPTLEEAVRLVEHLRNEQQVEEVGLHALTEVPLAFRPWYRVEVAVPQHAAEAPTERAAQQAAEQAAEQGVLVPEARTERVPAHPDAPVREEPATAVGEVAGAEQPEEPSEPAPSRRLRPAGRDLGFFAS